MCLGLHYCQWIAFTKCVCCKHAKFISNFFIIFYVYVVLQVLNEKQHEQALLNEYNFDHPDAFDMDLLLEVLKKLKEGRKVEVPVYNFVTHSRETTTVSSLCMSIISIITVFS